MTTETLRRRPVTSATLVDVDPVTDLISRLRLDRSARRDGVLIVEGPTDRRALSAAVGIDPRRIFQVNGRPNVFRCVAMLGGPELRGVVCVADRDFDQAESEWPEIAWLVFYDEADLEAMIVGSPALDRFIAEWASAPKVDSFGGLRGIRGSARAILRPLSAARTKNASDDAGIRFDALDVQDVVNKEGVLNVVGLIDRLASRSDVSRVVIEEAVVAEVRYCPHTETPLTKGRDAVAVIGVLLRKQIGSLIKQQASTEFVEKSLRLTLTATDFAETPFAFRLREAMDAVAVSSVEAE